MAEAQNRPCRLSNPFRQPHSGYSLGLPDYPWREDSCLQIWLT
ncbi:hypothetical protein CKAH01_10628 [Colletotrichum kahawae]|uniref:Uncharacterized protein n=1 Tax=Colletotrichum kahawae TaxID=34407 RepID=A0AAD9XY20_COLKA|nr:hypothetical protein CKAH01_10628 [Colletotrichum kahawae]